MTLDQFLTRFKHTIRATALPTLFEVTTVTYVEDVAYVTVTAVPTGWVVRGWAWRGAGASSHAVFKTPQTEEVARTVFAFLIGQQHRAMHARYRDRSGFTESG